MRSKYDFYFDNKNFLRNLNFSKCFNAERVLVMSAGHRLFVVIPIEDAFAKDAFVGSVERNSFRYLRPN